jgi:hypothetical protein
MRSNANAIYAFACLLLQVSSDHVTNQAKDGTEQHRQLTGTAHARSSQIFEAPLTGHSCTRAHHATQSVLTIFYLICTLSCACWVVWYVLCYRGVARWVGRGRRA